MDVVHVFDNAGAYLGHDLDLSRTGPEITGIPDTVSVVGPELPADTPRAAVVLMDGVVTVDGVIEALFRRQYAARNPESFVSLVDALVFTVLDLVAAQGATVRAKLKPETLRILAKLGAELASELTVGDDTDLDKAIAARKRRG